MSFFEFLRVWTVLEVLLEGVLAHMASGSDGRDGRLVDYGLACLLLCHDFSNEDVDVLWCFLV